MITPFTRITALLLLCCLFVSTATFSQTPPQTEKAKIKIIHPTKKGDEIYRATTVQPDVFNSRLSTVNKLPILKPKLPPSITYRGNDGPKSRVTLTVAPAASQRVTGTRKPEETVVDVTDTPTERCVTKQVNFTEVNQDFTEFVTAAGDVSWLYPGSIMDLESVISGSYRTFNHNRTPIMLATTLSGGKTGELVGNPTATSVQQARSNLINRKDQRDNGLSISSKITKVSSKTDLNLAIYGKYKTTGLDAELNSSFQLSNSKDHYFIDFTQAAYSAFIDDLQGASAFSTLPNGVDPSSLAYVNNVVYGRRAIMLVQTSDRSTNFKAKLKVAIENGISSGKLGGEAGYKRLMSQVDIKVLIYGGNQRTGLQAVSFDPLKAMNGFAKYIQSQFTSRSMSEALPIGYSLKLLANDDRCTVKTVYEMPVEDCVPTVGEKALVISITGVKAYKGEDRDNIEDYRLNVSADYRINGKPTQFLEKNFYGRLTKDMAGRIKELDNNSIVNFNEGNQLHTKVGETATVRTESVLPLRPGGENASYSLVLTTSMCERSGDGCGGMVPRGGKLTPLNVQAMLNILSGVIKIQSFPNHSLEGDNSYYILGHGFSAMKAVYENGKGTGTPPTKLISRIWTTNRNGRQAFIYFEIKLIDTPGSAR